MRSRSGSGVRLDRILFMVEQTIFSHQNPITALFANQKDFPGHAWIRDNVFIAQALWALYRAYMKCADFDEDLTKAKELGFTCVKMMQSILECMMRQADKVELFKKFQRPLDALHSKYAVDTKSTVCGDADWGHLQMDAISLYLLTLAQITASGLQVVRNFDEVAFIQNLVYYIETGYRTPDYGVWERGDKTNQGIRELNATSIGMVKAALQALNDVGDLFVDGSRGSVVHVLPDEIEQCSAMLSSMLPRESFSKETDAALLGIISYPAFCVEDPDLVTQTRETITERLMGKYGCRRFMRDGYKTVLEDASRLYYNKSELQQFEDIECEWPIFFCYLILDAMYSKDDDAVEAYWQQLESVLVYSDKGFRLVPELYVVGREHVAAEKSHPGTQVREPGGATPFLWAQSLYVIVCLLYEGFLLPAELDPLSRRLSVYEKRPPCEVQVTVLAESADVQRELRAHDIHVQRVDEIDPVFTILPASALGHLLAKIGESKKLNLSGRPLDRPIGLLSTSRLYQIGNKFVIFTPQFMDSRRSHLMYDIRILTDEWSSELQYIYASWNSVSISGRPLVVLVVTQGMLSTEGLSHFSNIHLNRYMKSTVIGAIKKINTGYLSGARVVMKDLSDFFRTTAVSKIEFRDKSAEEMLQSVAAEKVQFTLHTEDLNEGKSEKMASPRGSRTLRRGESVKDRSAYSLVHKASMRHRSIALDSNDADLVQLRLAYNSRPSSLVDTGSPQSPPQTRPLELVKEHSSGELRQQLLKTTKKGSDNKTAHGALKSEQMHEMKADDLLDLLNETTVLEEQISIIHCLWMKYGPDYDTELGCQHITVRMLTEEVHAKACEAREWALVRLTAGLLKKQLEELSKAVTHLLVRQKQITVGIASKKEEVITCPKTNEELEKIMNRAYGDDPNSFTLAQEIIVYLGSLVRTEPKLFLEMFRLRIGLIVQVLASELARLRHLSGGEAADTLLTVSPFELKSMIFSLLSGRLLEEYAEDGFQHSEAMRDTRTGIGSFRRQIEERKSLRKSTRSVGGMEIPMEEDEEDEGPEEDDFQFGIWLRHRRIDGALNRVPNGFYAILWDTVHKMPHGVKINDTILHWGLTQEMTRKEIKFALEVEEALNRIAEPEYREIIVEALWLLGRLEKLVLLDQPTVPRDRPLDVDAILRVANQIFVEHNKTLETIVTECCASETPNKTRCDGARGICKHFYDSAPAGEYGTSHYIIRALMQLFS
uniref:Phosphorylase b kinase regulatory subunit n=1 Tax=Caenorhabditis japonica TaxID=281687 RepID=A0A8R1DXZ7_CAEJA